jgi:acetyltransferase-like isoleucine patch superfamily enzyme
MAGAVVNACSQVGQGVIVNTNASVDHDGIVGDFASLAPGVALGGGVSIGQRTFLGLGAQVIHGLKLGNDICIGAGSLVLQSIEQDCVLAYGVPAKIVRKREPDEPCL